MSVRLMSLVWNITFPTQSQKLIALKLADHSNDEGGNIWPSKARIAREAGCSETTAQLTLKVFRACGLLCVVEDGGRGPRDTTKYRLNVEMLRELAENDTIIEGTSERLDIVINKGSESDGIGIRWDRPSELKGSVYPEKGVGITDPKPSLKNHHESPDSEKSNFDLKSEGKPVPKFTVSVSSVQWKAWKAWLTEIGRSDLSARMNEVTEIEVFGGRWPNKDSPLPKIAKPKLSDASKRMTGDAA